MKPAIFIDIPITKLINYKKIQQCKDMDIILIKSQTIYISFISYNFVYEKDTNTSSLIQLKNGELL